MALQHLLAGKVERPGTSLGGKGGDVGSRYACAYQYFHFLPGSFHQLPQQGSTLRVTTDNLSARLHGTRQALETLQEQGVEQIQFVTTLKTTTLSVEDLLTEGGSWFALEHDGLGSRRLSAAQAESLKCQLR